MSCVGFELAVTRSQLKSSIGVGFPKTVMVSTSVIEVHPLFNVKDTIYCPGAE